MERYLSTLRRPVTQHIIFWMLYFMFNFLRWGFFFRDFSYSFQSNLVEFSIHLAIVYFNLLYLMPKLFPEKMLRYILSLGFATIVISSIRILLTYQLVTTEIWKESNIEGLGLFDPNYFIAVFVGELYVVGFTMAIRLGLDYVMNIKKTRELETKRLEAELSFLRSQVQPHFFFNTLNNLYSLTLTKSNKAPETVLKLSNLMSYVIYEGKSELVPLSDEIKHIQDYLDLEKLRYGDRLQSSIEVSGVIDNRYIPPLILLPFIENSFKHGNTYSDPFPINIEIAVNNKSLKYIVRNELCLNEENLKNKEVQEGIGLKNTIRQLDLLFNSQYNLEIKEDSTTFNVILSIPVYDKMSDS